MQALSKTDFDLESYAPLIEEVIASGGEFRLFPRGTSMMPLLRQGKDSVILVKAQRPIVKSDIIFYKRENGQFVLHRVIGVRKDGSFWLCGDNQTEIEKGIDSSMVIASVSAVYRGEKRIEKNKFSLRAYEFFWCIMPLRRFIFAFRRLLSPIKRAFV
jgi:hypothetical protein